CPFLIQLPVEGTTKQKWVLVISAAGGERGVFEHYFVGDFDGKEFKNDNDAGKILTLDYGDSYYAAIPWNNLPANKKTYIGWMIPNPQKTSPWTGQMSIARDLSLKETQDGIRLIQKPAAVIENRFTKSSKERITTLKNFNVNSEEINLSKDKIKGNAYWIKAELITQPNATAGFRIAQKKDASGKVIHETVIAYDAANHKFYIDRTNAGAGKLNEKRLKQTVDMSDSSNKIQVEILMDKSSLEVFVNNGEAVFTTYIYPDTDADSFSIFSSGGHATINSLEIFDLSTLKQ
ncbi:MAG: GH32 C-terminal domain-containing protein, partial [Bacteroidota bacterium]